MTTVKDIYDYTDSFAPFDTQESYDNSGILSGDPNGEVKRALVVLDITSSAVKEAVRLKAGLIISHHPIIFRPIKNVMSGTALYSLIRNGISAICAHTNLDKSEEFGVNTVLSSAMGLHGCKRCGKGDLLFTAQTAAPMTAKEFADSIKTGLGLENTACTDGGRRIEKVGFCSGAGGDMIYAAAEEGCDAFVTGEMKHHEILFANEKNISVYILGHFNSENPVIEPLAKKLAERFPDVEFSVMEGDSDGVVFL